MYIMIEVECDTISEFYSHLTKLREDIKKQTKKLKLDPNTDEFPDSVNLDDDNCYGSHCVTIKPNDNPVFPAHLEAIGNVSVTAKLEIDYPEGTKTIEALLKKGRDIENCEEGKVVVLHLINDDAFTGIFKGMTSDDLVQLGSLKSGHVIGFKISNISKYYEEINP